MFERPSCLTCKALMTSFSGPKNPSARKTSWAGKNFSEPGTSSIFHRPPLSLVHSTRTTCCQTRNRAYQRELTGVETFDVSVFVGQELLCRDAELARI